MCGIRPVYGNRIRPLLCLTRKEIEEWLEEEQISYCTDETNEEDEYTRNRIRHKILPVMEQEINRQTVEHINRLSLQAEEIWEYLNLQTDAAWRQMVHPVDVSEENPEEKQQGKKEEKPAGLRIEEEEYAELPGVLKSLLIRRCICEMAEAQKDIEAVHMEAVRGLFGRQVGKAGIFRISSGRSEPMPELRSGEDLKIGIRKRIRKRLRKKKVPGSRAWN